jgi:hypothetical protein
MDRRSCGSRRYVNRRILVDDGRVIDGSGRSRCGTTCRRGLRRDRRVFYASDRCRRNGGANGGRMGGGSRTDRRIRRGLWCATGRNVDRSDVCLGINTLFGFDGHEGRRTVRLTQRPCYGKNRRFVMIDGCEKPAILLGYFNVLLLHRRHPDVMLLGNGELLGVRARP